MSNSGQELIDTDHYACDRIRDRLEEIHTIWRQLKEQSERKGAKLKEANELQKFDRNIEDVEVWIPEIKGRLMSEDYGKVDTSFMYLCNYLEKMLFEMFDYHNF